MGLQKRVFTRQPLLRGVGAGAGKVIAEVRHSVATGVVLGFIESTPIYMDRDDSGWVYIYQNKSFGLKEWKVHERKLHRYFLAVAVSAAKLNLALLQKAKF